MAAAASLLVAAVLGVQNVKLGSQLNHREHTLNSLLEAEKDLHVVHLKAADTIAGPGIQFFWNEKQHMGVAHGFRMRPAPAGRAYQLWIVRDGEPVSVGVFNSDPDGHALVEGLDLPPTSAGVTQVLLTVEPSGGSPRPTTQPMLRGTMGRGA
jgi:anti-sigma-K factor RskA